MANEFIARNGLISNAESTINGNLNAIGNIKITKTSNPTLTIQSESLLSNIESPRILFKGNENINFWIDATNEGLRISNGENPGSSYTLFKNDGQIVTSNKITTVSGGISVSGVDKNSIIFSNVTGGTVLTGINTGDQDLSNLATYDYVNNHTILSTGGTISGSLFIDSAINSTGTTSGAIRTNGGLGVVGNGYFGGTVVSPMFIGELSGNTSTSDKLKNSRTIWGQSFDGTENVSGNMFGVGSISASGKLTISNGGISVAGVSKTENIFTDLTGGTVLKGVNTGDQDLSGLVTYDYVNQNFPTTGHNHDDKYLQLTGGIINGDLMITGNTQVSNIKITSLNNGYLPYHVSDLSGLGNSPIYTTNSSVGIGTNTLMSTFHVKNYSSGNTENWIITLQNDNNNDLLKPTSGLLFVAGNTTSSKSGIIFQRTGSYGTGNLYFLNDSGENTNKPTISGSTKAAIMSNGNFLIGTSNDTGYKLNVNGSGYFSNGIIVKNVNQYENIFTDLTGGTVLKGVNTGDQDLSGLATYDYVDDTFLPFSGGIISGLLFVNNTTNSTNTTTGSIRTSGGLGVVGNGYFGGSVTAPTFIGNLTGNASSATKLSTSRTIWGQTDTDGTGNISGAMTGVSTITMSGALNGGTTSSFSSYSTANRFYTGYDSGTTNAMSCSNWFRSSGATGWLNDTYGGGIYMTDSTYVRVSHNKSFKVTSTASDSINTSGGVLASGEIRSNSKLTISSGGISVAGVSKTENIFTDVTGGTVLRGVNTGDQDLSDLATYDYVNQTFSIIGHKHSSLYTPNGSLESVFIDNSGDLHVKNNLYVSGSTFNTNTETINVNANYIYLRDGATTGLINGEYTGLEAIKYDGINNGRLVFDNTGTARVGDVGFEQPLATRDENVNMLENGFVYWDSTSGKLKTSTLTTTNISNNYYTQSVSDSRFVNVTGDSMSGKLTISSGGISVAGVSKTENIFTDVTGGTVLRGVNTGDQDLSDLATYDYVDENLVNKTTSIIAGAGLSGGGTLSGNVTLNHADTSSAISLTTSNSVFNVIQNATIAIDTYGHVTSTSYSNINLDDHFIKVTGDTMTGALTAPNYLRSDGATIWHSGNDGAGSGLDADLLDGINSSEYDHNYYIGYHPDFRNFVILLFDVNAITAHRINGRFYSIGGGGGRYTSTDVDIWYSRWSSTGFDRSINVFNKSSLSSLDLVTCVYNGITYLALKYDDNVQSKSWYFNGTGTESFTMVEYYNSQSSTVINSEIYNSLTDVNSLNTYSVRHGAKTFAYTDSNVESATKLANTRTIWGQNFDGTGNVSGAMTGVSTISASGNITTSGIVYTNGKANTGDQDLSNLSTYTYVDNTFLKKSGGTMTGPLNFNNVTWNNVGDDVAIGDIDVRGQLGIKAINTANPGIAFYNNSAVAVGNLISNAGTLQWSGNTLWHSGNDGAGSGLDADTLDGNQGNYYTDYTDTAVNGVQIGGRNLLSNSFAAGNNTTVIQDGVSIIAGANSDTYFLLKPASDLTSYRGRQLTLSFWVSGLTSALSFAWKNRGDLEFILELKNGLNTLTFVDNNLGVEDILFDDNVRTSQAAPIFLTQFKLELGNKATDWTPAPEDVTNDAQAKADAAKSAAISTASSDATTKSNTAESNAKTYSNNTFTTKTEFSSQLSVLNNSISAKVSQTDFNSLSTRVSSAEQKITSDAIISTVSSTITTAKNEAINAAAADATTKANNAKSSAVSTAATDATTKANTAESNAKTYSNNTFTPLTTYNTKIAQLESSISLKADSTTVNGINTRLSSAEAKITSDAINLTVKSQITTAVNGVQIGGRNLLSNSFAAGNNTTVIQDGVSIIAGANSDTYFLLKPASDLTSYRGRQLTLSFWVSGLTSALSFAWMNRFEPEFILELKNGLNTLTFIDYTLGAGNILFDDMVRTSQATPIFLTQFKLELGNKATAWTPAPEDVDASIALVQTNLNTHTSNTSNPHSVTKAQVGLSNVNNTSDANKPVSTAMQTALNLKANLESPTFTGNVTAPTFIGALSGNANTATKVYADTNGTNAIELVRGDMADDDCFRILVGGTASNAGYAEIATADDGTEPIYVRQYSGVFTSLVRTATLLNEAGNTSFPGAVTANRFYAGYDAGVANSVSCSDWFRSNGNTGWYNSTYGGGIYMTDYTYVRIHENKAFKVTSTASDSINTDGGVLAGGTISASGIITGSAIRTTNTSDYSLIVRNSTAAALFVQNSSAVSPQIASFRYGSATAGSGTSILDIYSGSVVSTVGYSKSGSNDSEVLLGGGGTCTRSDVLPKKQESLSVVNSSYVSSCSVMVYQLGHIVIIQGTFKTGGSASNDTAYFTIPSTIGVPSDDTGWSGVAGNQNTGIKMYIPKGSRTIYLIWNDAGTSTFYQMSWVYYTSNY